MTQRELVKCPHCESTSIFIHQEDDLCLCGECGEAWEQATKAHAVPQWIPVSERLPEQSQLGSTVEYLVYETLNNKVQHDYYIVPGDGTSPFWNYYQDHVTDWMPLPAPPTNQEVE